MQVHAHEHNTAGYACTIHVFAQLCS